MRNKLNITDITQGLSASLLLVTILILTNIASLAFDLDHYRHQYQRLDRPAVLNMTESELLWVTEEMIAYLKGQRADLDLVAQVAGEQITFFTSRELHHMEDVQGLFLGGMQIRRLGVVALIILLGVVGHKKKPPWCKWASLLKMAAIMGLVGIVVISALVYFSFDYWFDIFHLVSFSNDLWILDPSQHNLIKMVPQEFFFATTVNFMLRTLGQLLVLAMTTAFLEKRFGKGSR